MSPRPPKSIPRREGVPAAIRDHLIDTTERLLHTRPPTAVTARGIARAAGVSDGVLYNHFADKDELVIAALLRRFNQLSATFEAALPVAGEEPLERSLRRVATAALEFHTAGLPLVAGLISAPQLLRRFFDEIHGNNASIPAGVARLGGYFRDEQAAGRIAPGIDAMSLVTTMFGAVLTVALGQHLAGAAHSMVDDRIDGIVRALLEGALPRPR